MGTAPRDDAITALERLVHRYRVLTPEEAQAAGRIITGKPDFQLPEPRQPASHGEASNGSTPHAGSPPG